MYDKFSRQIGLINPEILDVPILIIGAGGVGSWAALALAKMGCQDITVQDYDKVELHNTASQLYGEADIGKSKVLALGKTVKRLTGMEIVENATRWKSGQEIKQRIVISAVDDIDLRKEIWKDIKANPEVDFYIDARMAGDLIRIYPVVLDGKYELYEKSLVPKSRVEQGVCTERAVVYNTLICGGIIANFVKKFISKGWLPKEYILDLVNLGRG